METQVSLHFINPLIKVLKQHQVSIHTIAQAAKVDPALLDEHNDTLPLLELCQLWHAAIDCLQDPLLALKAGQLVHPSDYGLIGALAMNCDDLQDSLLHMNQYRYLFNGGFSARIDLEENARYEMICPEQFDSALVRPIIELDFTACITMARFLTNNLQDKLLTPLEASFNYKPLADIPAYEALLLCPVSFGQTSNHLIAPQESLKVRIHAPNHLLKKSIIQQMESIKQHSLRPFSLAREVEVFIASRFPNCPDIEETAKQFNTSKRTLKRRLQGEGKTFKQITDELRRDRAIKAVIKATQPISEIAYEMGFSSTSSFHKAFKRWTGISPGSYFKERA